MVIRFRDPQGVRGQDESVVAGRTSGAGGLILADLFLLVLG